MSLYLVVFIMLLAFAVYEYLQRKTQKWLYWIAFGVLAAMLCLRWGQGTDYFGYLYNYLLTPPIWQLKKLFNGVVHGEPGWLLVCALFRTVNAPFELLVFLISGVEMYCLHRFVSKYSPLRTVTLLLAFPTIYLTYVVSALRQGLVMMVFLGFMIDWLYRGKWKHYLIATAVCALFHSSALVFLALFAIRLFTLDTKKTLILMLACTVLGFAASWVLPKISSAFAYYAKSGMSIVAIGERIASTLLILCIFRGVLDGKLRQKNRVLLFLLQIYLYGSLIYCFLMWNAIISSRFAVYFKAVEIGLFAVALRSRVPLCKAAAGYLLALTVVMYFKNIGSYIEQGNYFETVSVWNYPYFTFFTRGQITKWRTLPYDFSPWFQLRVIQPLQTEVHTFLNRLVYGIRLG